MTYDLLIIGGGPAGYTAAERAARGGLKTMLIEKNALGGVCLNEGCIPTKTLLYSAKVLNTVESASKYAVKATAEAIDLPKVIARKTKVVRKLSAGIRTRMNDAGVEVLLAEAKVLRSEANNYVVEADGNEYQAKNLLLCTGSDTFIPPIPGVQETDYWTSREALLNKELPASLLVIGGGVIGMEFASFFNSLGCQVHVVEMMPEILPGIDGELVAELRAAYEKRGMKFYLGHKVTAVRNGSVSVEFEGNAFDIEAEKILMSVGRRPVTLGLDVLGLEMQGKGVKVDEYMRTNLPGVYAAGDITGFSLLAHTAVREAEVAVDHILGKPDAGMSYKAVPGVVYTNPEIAGVGTSEDELKSKGIDYVVKKLPMAFSGRFVAENEQGSGTCKLILSPEDKLLGAFMIGNPASEMIVIAAMAIEKGMMGDELAKIVFPHPTVCEIIKETLELTTI